MDSVYTITHHATFLDQQMCSYPEKKQDKHEPKFAIRHFELIASCYECGNVMT